MSNNLFTAIGFLVVGINYAIAKALGFSVLGMKESIIFAVIDIALAVFFFIRYRKEKHQGEDKEDI